MSTAIVAGLSTAFFILGLVYVASLILEARDHHKASLKTKGNQMQLLKGVTAIENRPVRIAFNAEYLDQASGVLGTQATALRTQVFTVVGHDDRGVNLYYGQIDDATKLTAESPVIFAPWNAIGLIVPADAAFSARKVA